MMTKKMAFEWEKFYLLTLAYDIIDGTPTREQVQSVIEHRILPECDKEAEIFGQLMSQIPGIEEPSGTEERTAVRTFFVLYNPKQKFYKNYISFHNGDFYAIQNYMHLFAEHSTVSLRK